MEKHRQEVLLKEYEVCQQHNDSTGNHVWLSTTIFISANVAALGWLGKVVLTEEKPDLLSSLVIITAIGVAMMVILCFWRRWLNRMRFLFRINYERMRCIESELQMFKNWMAYGLDRMEDGEWDKIPEKTRVELDAIYDKAELVQTQNGRRRPRPSIYAKSKGFEGLRQIVPTMIIFWGIFVVFSWIKFIVS